MKNFSKKLLAVMTALLLVLTSTKSLDLVLAAGDDEVIILHTNDMHGHIEGVSDYGDVLYQLARYKTYADDVNASFIFDGGDAFQGLPLNNITKGSVMAEIMLEIGYTAYALGNHEFDYSREVALGVEDGWYKTLKAGGGVVVSSNTVYKGFSGKTDGEHVYNQYLHVGKTRSGEDFDLLVVGATTPETKVKADPRHSEGIEFSDPYPAVKAAIEKAIAEGETFDLIVANVHLGTDLETKKEWRGDYLADMLSKEAAFSAYDIIVIDGHSHTAYSEGRKFGNNVLYGQTGASLSNIGKIIYNKVDFTKSKLELVQVMDGYVVEENFAANYAPDPVIKKMIDDATEQFDELTKEVMIDKLPYEFNGVREFVRTRETNLGNLIADSMLDYALDTFSAYSHVAVMNGGGIRASLQAGVPITLKDVITVMPYGNRIVQIDVTGEELYEMFEWSYKGEASDELDEDGVPLLHEDPAILHISRSMKVYFDPNKQPATKDGQKGERVLDILVQEEVGGEFVPVDLTKTYKVVTLEFLAVGGDGYSMLGGARVEGGNDADIFADFLKAAGKDGSFDWTVYNPKLTKQRVIPSLAFDRALLEELVKDVKAKLKDEAKYSKDSFKALKAAYDTAVLALEDEEISDSELRLVYENLLEANNNLKSSIPPTGIYTGLASASATLAASTMVLFVLKKKRD